MSKNIKANVKGIASDSEETPTCWLLDRCNHQRLQNIQDDMQRLFFFYSFREVKTPSFKLKDYLSCV